MKFGILRRCICIGTCLLLILSGCNHQQQNAKVLEATPVEVEVVNETVGGSTQIYVGTLEATSSSTLSFAVTGNVTRVYVKEGDFVRQGKLLAELDEQSYRESHTAAVASLRQAQDGYDRLKTLHDKGSITEVQWVEMETKLAQAKSMEAITQRNLSNCKLYAPFTGVIGKCVTEIGMNVLPGSAAFTLLKIDYVNVKVPIPENVISSIRIGQPVTISIPAVNNKQFSGKINSKGIIANPMSHNYDVLVPIANPTREMMPGMVCNVQIPNTESNFVIILPNHVVKLSHDGKHYVWLAKNKMAQQQMVTTGGLAQQGIVITSGLSVGDSVIVRGEQKVSDGTKIEILR
ncbi:MAG: efflux RND transporter periplasmic adaptor subunit [Bacteroidales bacterium]|nr:efflux RND transporter periplasmic adaptor subunit [Bacteroidales bacterium]